MASGIVPDNFETLPIAIVQAQFGDVITVRSSYSFTGTLILPNKGTPPFPSGDNRNYIVIQTDKLASLPATNSTPPSIISNPGFAGRVNPSHGGFMPKLIAPSGQDVSLIDADPGAKYFRFIGIELTANTGSNAGSYHFRTYLARLDGTSGGTQGDVGNGIPNSMAMLPSYIQFDRCYIHAFAYNEVLLHALCLYTLNADVCNCYISGFNGQSGDGQAIWCVGPGPYTLVNNYAEASTENIFFGRGDFAYSAANGGNPPGCGSSGNLTSLVQYNSLIKSDHWRFKSGAQFLAPTSSANYFCKNLLEVKNGKNINILNNFMMNSFDEFDQHGAGIGINMINYSGWEHAENITWQNNVISTTCAGLYLAFTFEGGNTNPLTNANYIKNITFRNNLFVRLSEDGQFGNLYPPSGQIDGRNYVVEIACSVNTEPIQGLVIDHNTFVVASAQNYGADQFLIMAYQAGTIGSAATGVTEFAFTNNILPEQLYGFGWAPNGFNGGSFANDVSDYKLMFPGGIMGGNVAYTNNPPFPPATSPTTGSFMAQYDTTRTNFNPSSLAGVGFASPGSLTFPGTNGQSVTVSTYPLASTSNFVGRATDGTNPGVDYSQLAWGAAVPPFVTSTIIRNSPISISQGSDAQVIVDVSSGIGTPTGDVTVLLNPGPNQQSFGPITLVNGEAIFTILQPATGSYTIAANYTGLANQWQPSSGAGTLAVTGALPPGIVTAIATQITYPANLPVAVQVRGQSAIPTGNVTLTIDGTAVGSLPLNTDGNAWFIVPGLSGGIHNMSVFYSGDSNFASNSMVGLAFISAAACSMALLAPPINVGQNALAQVTCSSEPLLHQADLKYLGGFTVPSGTFGNTDFQYSGRAMVFNPAGNNGAGSLFFAKSEAGTNNDLCEISIPTTPVNTNVYGNLPVASVLQNFRNVLAAPLPNNTLHSVGNYLQIGGLVLSGPGIVGTAAVNYDANGDAAQSHFTLDSLNLATANVAGFYAVGNAPTVPTAGCIAGWMCRVPDEWRQAFGMPYLSGQGALDFVPRTSWGPSAFGFDPSKLNYSSPAPALAYFHYYNTQPFGDPYPVRPNPIYDANTRVTGIFFPSGFRTVAFAAYGGSWMNSPNDVTCYGQPGDVLGIGGIGAGIDNLGNPVTGITINDGTNYKGGHAILKPNGTADYLNYLQCYDVSDLLAVLAGSKSVTSVQPYETWRIQFPLGDSGRNMGGVAYDPANKRLYLCQKNAGGPFTSMPIVHVYSVN